MITSYGNNGNNAEFVEQVRGRAQQKVAEYHQLLHERERIAMLLERTKTYVNQLNSFLEAEGQSPIPLKEYPRGGSPVGKPGNRSKDFPLRKVEWTGMTLDAIIRSILEAAPNEVYHADEIAHRIYEIQNSTDLRRVKRSIVSNLRRQAKKGFWEALKGNRYKAKASAQERLIQA